MTEKALKYSSPQVASKNDYSPGYSSLYNYSITTDILSIPSILRPSDHTNLTGRGSLIGRDHQNISTSLNGRQNIGYGITSGHLPPFNGGMRGSIDIMEPIKEFEDYKKFEFNRFKCNPICREFNGREFDRTPKNNLSRCFLSPDRSTLFQLTEVYLVLKCLI